MYVGMEVVYQIVLCYHPYILAFSYPYIFFLLLATSCLCHHL